MSYSKTIIRGNLGQDPEIVTFQNGNKLAKLSIATTEKWKTKDGQKQEKTQWHRFEFGGPIVDAVIIPYVHKGDSILVDGQLDYQEYEKEGSTKYVTVIKGQTLDLLGGRSEGSAGHNTNSAPAPQRSQQGAPPAVDEIDDIPFTPLQSYP